MQETSAAKSPSIFDAASTSSTPYNVLDLQYSNSSISENKAMSETSEIRGPKRRKFGEFASVTQHIEADVN